MNVLRQISVLFVFLFVASVVFGFNVCNVDVDEPWFEVQDSSGDSLVIVDDDGDVYFEGNDHTLNNKDSVESFEVGGAFFNSVTSKFASFNQELALVPGTSNSLIVRAVNGTNVTSFDENGNINTAGMGVYEHSQAGCMPDGGYCVGDVLEDRDYYCDITGSRTGICNVTILSSTDCTTLVSSDSDGGHNNRTRGTLRDYHSCFGGACQYDLYTDSCSGNVLTEYSPFGSSYRADSINCVDESYYYCVGSNRYYKLFECAVGACSVDRDMFVETCVAPGPDYSSWSCVSDTRRVRVVTTYSPVCAASGCSVSSVNSNEYENAPSGYLCGGGSWVPAPKVISISASPSSWKVNLPGC